MRALLVSVALAFVSAAQATSTLHIKVTVDDRPVVRHALLISDVPVSAAPRRVLTGTDGTVDVRLKPGAYTVESDNPAMIGGKGYGWTQQVTIFSGRDTTLELNASNAEIGTPATAEPETPDLQSVFERWQGSVLTVWSETAYGLGFLVDPKGLIITNRHVTGKSQSAEVEVTPTVKVSARVVASDLGKNVAVLWVDPATVASIKPVPLAVASAVGALRGKEVFGVGAVLHGRKFMTTATINSVSGGKIDSDVTVDPGNEGGPLFSAEGQAIGITTLGPRRMEGPPIADVIAIDAARDLIAQAHSKIQGVQPPSATHLPIEPSRKISEDALKAVTEGKAPNNVDYQVKSPDFDVTFVTPVTLYFMARRAERGTYPFGEFENWGEYVSNYPPVVMVRVTPKMTEGFWQVVGRQAAQTQGVALPPGAKHPKAPFLKTSLYCDGAEVPPIHPFKIAHQLENYDIIYEGLYVYDPSAIASCGSVKLVLFSEKDPAKGEPVAVEQKTLEQIRKDFSLH